MKAVQTLTVTLFVGLLTVLAIGCGSMPESSTPTPSLPTPIAVTPVPTLTSMVPTEVTPATMAVNPAPTHTQIAPTPVEPAPTTVNLIPTPDRPIPIVVTDPATSVPDGLMEETGDPEALNEAQADLDRHRAIWTSNSAGHYSFVLTPSCFCPQDLLKPVRISVENGIVGSVTYVESGMAPDHGWYDRYVTIDQLFNTIQEAIDLQAFEVTVAYDSQIGYPTNARIDYNYRMSDEEYMFTASGYSPGG